MVFGGTGGARASGASGLVSIGGGAVVAMGSGTGRWRKTYTIGCTIWLCADQTNRGGRDVRTARKVEKEGVWRLVGCGGLVMGGGGWWVGGRSVFGRMTWFDLRQGGRRWGDGW